MRADVDFWTKQGTIVYDTLVPSREEIAELGIFDAYGYEFVSEEPYMYSPS